MNGWCRYSVATVRFRAASFVAAFLALLGAAALVCASVALLESGLRAAPPVNRYATADAVVTGPTRIRPDGADAFESVRLGVPAEVPADVVDRVKAVPEVVGVVRDRMTGAGGAAGPVVALVITAAPGVDESRLVRALAAVIGDGLEIHTGKDIPLVERRDLAQGRELLLLVATSFGGLAVIVALFVVVATLGLAVDGRRRELATLRTLGATPGDVLRLLTTEVVILALASLVPGILLGVGVAQWLATGLATADVMPAELPLRYGRLTFVATTIVILLTALGGVIAAGMRPAHAHPVEAMREAAVPATQHGGGRITAGLVLLVVGGGTALTPLILRNEVGTAGTGSAALLLAIAAAVLGPVVLRPLLSLVRRPLARTGASGFHAARSLRADPRRAASVITPVVVALGVGLTIVGNHYVMGIAMERQAADSVTASAVVTSPQGLPDDLVSDLTALPGVTAATTLRDTRIHVPHRVFDEVELATLTARGVGADADQTLDPGIVEGELADLHGRSIALDTSTARLLRFRVGDTVPLHTDDGARMDLRLVALYSRGLGVGCALLPDGVLDGHAPPPTRALIRTDLSHAASVSAVVARHPDVALSRPGALSTGPQAESDTTAWINLGGLGVILAYLAIALVNHLVMSTSARSQEFAAMRLAGMTRGQVSSAVAWEGLVLSGLAVVTGFGIAALPLSAAVMGLIGEPAHVLPATLVVVVIAATLLVVLGSTLLTTRRSLKIPAVIVITGLKA